MFDHILINSSQSPLRMGALVALGQDIVNLSLDYKLVYSIIPFLILTVLF